MSYQPPNQPQEPYQGQPQQYQPQQNYGPPQQYPQQPQFYPQQPPKKKHTGRNIFLGCGGAVVAVVVIIIIVIVASAANAPKTNTGSVVSTATTGTGQATTGPAGPSTFKIGQVVSVGSTWQITVLSAKTSGPGQVNTLQHPGDQYLVVTIAVKNISGKSQNMSSALQWNLQDSTGQKYNITIDPDAGGTLDGAVAAGSPLKGVIAYEVPKNIHSFTLSFQNDIISSDQSIWAITV